MSKKTLGRGSQYVSDHFQNEITFLGMTSSPAFVREPEGNGCAERFIRTLKENLSAARQKVMYKVMYNLPFRATKKGPAI